ncbi:DNA-binding transcriptional regulator, LysR family [Lentibacillus halodurans]|uniref:DNA-binding transcriptional regulator, LysR family n=1 Tax=Lentibacillus halodurans TaxID=237679 RepID=A0A1I0X5H3_9BACI|nr:LysR family transcriptional regulator [Lentibacillus halodurans]SFA95630.1 DNA-binding transcriptional regulator, LysR family [Lentibacillus halodurans]
MDIRQLKYFITLANERTYTRAAKLLHISQPSLSASIKKLEQEVGLTLIDRTARQFRMTKEGQILYREAQKLLHHYEHVSLEMDRLKQQGPLELSVGLIESSMFFVPDILTRFKQEYHDVRISLLETLSLGDVKNALNNFDIHLAITNQYIHQQDIETTPIYEESLVALIPPEHSLGDKDVLHIHDLEGENFIVCKEGFQTRQDILNAFSKSGVKPNIQFEIERFETGCSLVEDGLGITVVPENYVRYSKQTDCSIKGIEGANISRIVYLAYDKNRYLPPNVMRLIELVKEFFA